MTTVNRPSLTLRRTATAALVAPVLALSACSGDAPVTTTSPSSGAATTGGSTTTTGATTSAATGTASGTATSSGATSSAAAPVDRRVDTPVNATVKDPLMGHTVQITQLSRNVPWPAALQSSARAKAFELIGVKVKVQAGSRYNASVAADMLQLRTGGQTYTNTREFGPSVLPTFPGAPEGKAGEGWQVYVVPRGTTAPYELVLYRPAYVVPATKQNIPVASFPVKIA